MVWHLDLQLTIWRHPRLNGSDLSTWKTIRVRQLSVLCLLAWQRDLIRCAHLNAITIWLDAHRLWLELSEINGDKVAIGLLANGGIVEFWRL